MISSSAEFPSLHKLLYLQKIGQIDISDADLQQSIYNQGLIKANSIGNINITKIWVSSYDDYMLYSGLTATLIEIVNFNHTALTHLYSSSIKLNQQPAIMIKKSDQSLKYLRSYVDISALSFQHIYLNASSQNQYTTILFIHTTFLISIHIDYCLFHDLELNVHKFSNIKQSSAMMLMVMQSETLISNTQFVRSKSNSYISFLYATAINFTVDTCLFRNSNYDEQAGASMETSIKTLGGFMYVEPKILNITNCQFSNSLAYRGGAAYVLAAQT